MKVIELSKDDIAEVRVAGVGVVLTITTEVDVDESVAFSVHDELNAEVIYENNLGE